MSAPGWYSDPSAPGQQRWWDGSRWTDHVAPAPSPAPGPPPSPYATRQPMSPESARQWGMLAHLSAFGGLLVGGFTFLGPLVVYLIKKDEDPFVADQSREALNFNLSALLYFVALGIVGTILLIVLIGILVFLLMIPLAIAWLVLVILASVAANRGEAYRYPLTIRFIKT